ncbi:MAG: response regulator [Parcubacteria group bacterium]|nr:response regulator [Parcubacteria group bacterium]
MSEEKKTILVVEDDVFLMNLLTMKLRREGFEVAQAFDGVEAVEQATRLRPALILLDLVLPKKNGFEVLQEIGQDPQLGQVPIVVISNLGQESDIARGKELGAVDYYVKARLSIDDLIKRVKELIVD